MSQTMEEIKKLAADVFTLRKKCQDSGQVTEQNIQQMRLLHGNAIKIVYQYIKPTSDPIETSILINLVDSMGKSILKSEKQLYKNKIYISNSPKEIKTQEYTLKQNGDKYILSIKPTEQKPDIKNFSDTSMNVFSNGNYSETSEDVNTEKNYSDVFLSNTEKGLTEQIADLKTEHVNNVLKKVGGKTIISLPETTYSDNQLNIDTDELTLGITEMIDNVDTDKVNSVLSKYADMTGGRKMPVTIIRYWGGEWCGPSIKSTPAWNEFKKKIKSIYPELLIWHLNFYDTTDENKRKVLDIADISGFPTIRLYHDGQVDEFSGNRLDSNEIVEFVKTTLK